MSCVSQSLAHFPIFSAMVNRIGTKDQSVNDDICQQNGDKLAPKVPSCTIKLT
jgi:hypothetical protein